MIQYYFSRLLWEHFSRRKFYAAVIRDDFLFIISLGIGDCSGTYVHRLVEIHFAIICFVKMTVLLWILLLVIWETCRFEDLDLHILRAGVRVARPQRSSFIQSVPVLSPWQGWAVTQCPCWCFILGFPMDTLDILFLILSGRCQSYPSEPQPGKSSIPVWIWEREREWILGLRLSLLCWADNQGCRPRCCSFLTTSILPWKMPFQGISPPLSGKSSTNRVNPQELKPAELSREHVCQLDGARVCAVGVQRTERQGPLGL